MPHAHLTVRRDDMCSLAETYMSQRETSNEDEEFNTVIPWYVRPMNAKTDPTNRSRTYEYDHVRTIMTTALSIVSTAEYSSLHNQRIFGPHIPKSSSPPESALKWHVSNTSKSSETSWILQVTAPRRYPGCPPHVHLTIVQPQLHKLLESRTVLASGLGDICR